MGYPTERSANNGATIIVVVLAAFVGLIMLAGLGISFFLASKVSATRQLAIVERERAMAVQQGLLDAERAMQEARRAEQVARQGYEAALAKANAVKELAQDSRPNISIAIDRAGEITLGGEPLELAELRDRLNAARQQQGEMSLIIEADRHCLIKHIQAVLSLCEDEEFGDVILTSADRDDAWGEGVSAEAEP